MGLRGVRRDEAGRLGLVEDVVEGDGAQAAAHDDVEQLVVDARDGRMVEVADDDVLGNVVLVGVGDDVARREDRVVSMLRSTWW